MRTQDSAGDVRARSDGSDGRRSKVDACVSDSSSSDEDVDDAPANSSPHAAVDRGCRPPTTFQQRVASAKLAAAASRRSTPAASASGPAQRPAKTAAQQRHDSLTTLDPDRLADLLGGTKSLTLCNLLPAGLNTRTSNDDAYSDGEETAKMSSKKRTNSAIRHSQKAAVAANSDVNEQSVKDKKLKRKPQQKIDKIDMRPVSAAVTEDGDKKKPVRIKDDAGRKRDREDGRGRRNDDVAEEQSTRTRKHHREVADLPTVPIFNVGEYHPAETAKAERSPRLDAIKKDVERAHKENSRRQRKAERKSQKQQSAAAGSGGDGGGRRGRSGEDLPGTRRTLRTDDALKKGKSQLVKLKVDSVEVDAWLILVVGAQIRTCTRWPHHWRVVSTAQ